MHFILGPLMGGPLCRMLVLKNGNVPCRYILGTFLSVLKASMSHADLKI